MCKSEIFATIIKIVSMETEVSESLILSDCKSTDTVDARYLLVFSLTELIISTFYCLLYTQN